MNYVIYNSPCVMGEKIRAKEMQTDVNGKDYLASP
jgi:hypothetical protein